MPPAPEQEPGKSKPKHHRDFEKSNVTGVLARDLNIVPGSNDEAMDMPSPGGAIQFTTNKDPKKNTLLKLNKLLGIEGEDVAMKSIRIIRRNKYGVQIQDVTGSCDKDGLNQGRGLGPYSDRPFPHMPCSPTSGRTWWISAADWDNIWMPLPPGQGGAGGAGGGMGGPGGGLGGPAGGGAAPPPPPGGAGAGAPPA